MGCKTCKGGVTLIMGTQSVTIRFSTDDDAQSLTACLEQLLSHLNWDPAEE